MGCWNAIIFIAFQEVYHLQIRGFPRAYVSLATGKPSELVLPFIP